MELKRFSDLTLPFELREELKKPLGDLYVGEIEVNIKRLKEYLCEAEPPMFASVGHRSRQKAENILSPF